MGFLARIGRWFLGALSYPRDAIESGPTPTAFQSGWRSGGYGGQKWTFGLSRSGAAPTLNHETIRRNARAQWHKSLAARAIIERKVNTVVDCGVRRECQPDELILGITSKEAEEWARDVEARFHLWASKKTCSRNERLNFYQIQRLAMLHRERDGEWFARLFYNPRRDLMNSLQIQLLDPGQIRGAAYTNTETLQPLSNMDGIHRDESGREIAYDVWVADAKQGFKPITVPAVGRRSRRPMMLHGYTPEYAGQGRGFSSIAHAIQELENLTDFSAASIKKAIIESSINLYVKPSKDAPASMPFADQLSGPASKYDAPNEPGETTDTLAGADLINYAELNDVNLRPGSVGIFNLESGEDLKAFEPRSPSEHFSKFYEAFVGALAASCDVPPEIVMLRFGQNYSASRAVIVLFYRAALRGRTNEAADFYDPVFAIWLAGEIARGRISAPGWSDPVLRAAWLNGSWDGPPVPDIDPLKMAKANEVNVWKLGAKTLDGVAKEINGSRGTTNRARLAKQLDEMPVAPWIRTFGAGGAIDDDEDEPPIEPEELIDDDDETED